MKQLIVSFIPDSKLYLGWKPKYNFESGIKETINWYMNNQEWMDDVTSGDYLKYYEQMYSKK